MRIFFSFACAFIFSFCWSWTLSWAVAVHGVLLRSTIERWCVWRGSGRKQRQQKSNDPAYGNRGARLRSLLDQGQAGRTGAGTFRAGAVRASGRWTGCGDGGVAGGPAGFSELSRSAPRGSLLRIDAGPSRSAAWRSGSPTRCWCVHAGRGGFRGGLCG
jgi:hypothetical protein